MRQFVRRSTPTRAPGPVPRRVTLLRRGWLRLHKWTGLCLGAVLALLGLTGSVNVFYRELDRWLNPHMFAATATAHPVGAVAALRAVRQAVPEPVRFMNAPDRVFPVWTVLFRRGGGYWRATVDPGTGRLLGIQNLDHSLIRLIYRLHESLLLERWWGEQFVGVMGLVLVLMAISGVWLWWPRSGLLLALVRLRRLPRQMLYRDLHVLAGAWSALLLLGVAVTGVGVVFPGLIRPAVRLLSPVNREQPLSRPDPGRPFAVDADRAIALAAAAAPGEAASYVFTPGAPDWVWSVGLRWRNGSTAELNAGAASVDPWTGAVETRRLPARMTTGERFMDMQLWLHNGSVFGWPGRIAVFASGLAPSALFGTALLFWLRKGRLRRRTERRRRAAIVAASSGS